MTWHDSDVSRFGASQLQLCPLDPESDKVSGETDIRTVFFNFFFYWKAKITSCPAALNKNGTQLWAPFKQRATVGGRREVTGWIALSRKYAANKRCGVSVVSFWFDFEEVDTWSGAKLSRRTTDAGRQSNFQDVMCTRTCTTVRIQKKKEKK